MTILTLLLALAPHAPTHASDPPLNVVVFLTDDQGIADLGCYGADDIPTPHLDRLAAEGMLFTDFHVSQAVCTASRASLLTGCDAERVGLRGALGPSARVGLHPDEVTIADMLRPLGYRSAAFGKWHLGHHRAFLPLQQGFDEYAGLPYSNDMWPVGYDGAPKGAENPVWGPYPALPYLQGNETALEVETLEDQTRLTERATSRAVRFIRENAEDPFFLYLPYSMPHVPLGRPLRLAGKSARGPYGDVIAEIDASVGRVLTTLDRTGVADHTLVVFTSDNGPWLRYGDHAGSAGPLREGKLTIWEGGNRVPCLMRLPGRIAPGSRCDALTGTIDLLPTVAALTGAKPPDRPIDGVSLVPLLTEPDAESFRRAYLYYWGGALLAVRRDGFKLVFPHRYTSTEGMEPGEDGFPGPQRGVEFEGALYDLDADPGERIDVADEHPDVVAELEAVAERARAALGDARTGRRGAETRPPGRLDPDRAPRVDHLAVGSTVDLDAEPHERYRNIGAAVLADGALGSEDFTDGRWIGFRGTDFEATIDLGGMTPIREITCSFLRAQVSWIFVPRTVEFAVSRDGETYRILDSVDVTMEPDRAAEAVPIGVEAEPGEEARFVRVRATPMSSCPDGHPGAGKPPWLFVDEILVER
ncbi:MAG: sulfatase-like hydrolase/transferase [Planctomycetota bacterium]